MAIALIAHLKKFFAIELLQLPLQFGHGFALGDRLNKNRHGIMQDKLQLIFL